MLPSGQALVRSASPAHTVAKAPRPTAAEASAKRPRISPHASTALPRWDASAARPSSATCASRSPRLSSMAVARMASSSAAASPRGMDSQSLSSTIVQSGSADSMLGSTGLSSADSAWRSRSGSAAQLSDSGCSVRPPRSSHRSAASGPKVGSKASEHASSNSAATTSGSSGASRWAWSSARSSRTSTAESASPVSARSGRPPTVRSRKARSSPTAGPASSRAGQRSPRDSANPLAAAILSDCPEDGSPASATVCWRVGRATDSASARVTGCMGRTQLNPRPARPRPLEAAAGTARWSRGADWSSAPGCWSPGSDGRFGRWSPMCPCAWIPPVP